MQLCDDSLDLALDAEQARRQTFALAQARGQCPGAEAIDLLQERAVSSAGEARLLFVADSEGQELGSFGFYLENHANDGGFKWFSQDILNSDDQFAHFMAFEDERDREGILYFGFEDLARSHTDYDYSDMIVKVTGVRGATPAPEPRAALAFVLGALVIRSAVRRRAARS